MARENEDRGSYAAGGAASSPPTMSTVATIHRRRAAVLATTRRGLNNPWAGFETPTVGFRVCAMAGVQLTAPARLLLFSCRREPGHRSGDISITPIGGVSPFLATTQPSCRRDSLKRRGVATPGRVG